MASPKEIKGRILSVGNTMKITRTMELVATAKAKKATDRVNAAKPYAMKIKELITSLAANAGNIDHPLLRSEESPQKAALLVITSNRGLCGGFNNNVIKLAFKAIDKYKTDGQSVETQLVGKKAISTFDFNGYEYGNAITTIDDKPTIEEAVEIAEKYIKAYSNGELDKIEIVYTRYMSAGKQLAVKETLLPLSLEETNNADPSVTSSTGSGSTLFEPDANSILQSLLPKSVRVAIYQALLDSASSEQIARRIAMKNATDAAEDIVKELKLTYNRARQSKITQEIAEIIGGAAAVE